MCSLHYKDVIDYIKRDDYFNLLNNAWDLIEKCESNEWNLEMFIYLAARLDRELVLDFLIITCASEYDESQFQRIIKNVINIAKECKNYELINYMKENWINL